MLKFILIVILVIIILRIIAGVFLSRFSIHIERQSLEDARRWQEDHYDVSWYDHLEKKQYTVESYDHYILHVEYISNPKESRRYILISHGYTDNHIGSLKYTQMYLDLGFNVILYDLRGHGLNEPTYCTYTIRERRDLYALIRDSRKRYPDAELFGIHGESLGSATSIAVLEYQPPVDFVVADCGFSEITSVMVRGLIGMHLPPSLIHPASVITKLTRGHFYREMRPIRSLSENTIPILFIHGQEDDFILPVHSEKMKKATKGYSEIHVIPGAGHAASILTAPEEYRKIVAAFLDTILSNR